MWRSDDQALLERLENEALLRLIWTRSTRPSAPPPSPRAAGLLHLVRESAEGERAARRALEGDVDPLLAALRPPTYRGLRPVLVHHLALLHHATARALDPEAHDEALAAFEHAFSAWATLVDEDAYLSALAASASAGALSSQEEAACAEAPPRRLLAELAEGAREDLDAHGPRTRLAL
ncbi:MAG: hypothetical protein KF901_34515, partial [Myxococcales bacterium]|nr:hypothetical protein [Myxococcales bacterium]